MPLQYSDYKGAQLITGLRKIHEKNVVHGDISVRNIMQSKQGVAKFIDLNPMDPLSESKKSRDIRYLGKSLLEMKFAKSLEQENHRMLSYIAKHEDIYSKAQSNQAYQELKYNNAWFTYSLTQSGSIEKVPGDMDTFLELLGMEEIIKRDLEKQAGEVFSFDGKFAKFISEQPDPENTDFTAMALYMLEHGQIPNNADGILAKLLRVKQQN